MLETSRGLQFYYNNGGKLRFNSIENGIMVKKVNLGGVHANHPRYTEYMAQRVAEIYFDVKKLDAPLEFKIQEFDILLKELVNETKTLIIQKSVHSNTKLNLLF